MYYVSAMKNISDICDTLGRKNMSEALRVSKAAIGNAVSDGKFPARWYAVISAMCADAEIECPESLFGFIAPASASDTASERGAA